MQALRLVVNLSTNPPMIEYLQSADVSHDKSSKYVFQGSLIKVGFFKSQSETGKIDKFFEGPP